MKPNELLERLQAPPIPLRIDEDGALRVGETRITLETVLIGFQNGSSPEELVLQYPVLKLEDVYTLLAYYLHNRALFDQFLESIRHEAEAKFAHYERLYPTADLRKRLLVSGGAGHYARAGALQKSAPPAR